MNSREVVNRYLQKAAQQFSLSDFYAINRRPDIISGYNFHTYNLTVEFLDMVKAELPNQPWPIGIHKVIASKLSCPNGKVSQAINELVENGSVYKQKDGVVYDYTGKIIAKDMTRIKV